MLTYTTVTSKGQAVIPKAIRDQFGIKPKTRVGYGVKNGQVVVEVAPTVASMKGFIKTNIRLSDTQLEKAAEDAWAEAAEERYVRTLNPKEKKLFRKRFSRNGRSR